MSINVILGISAVLMFLPIIVAYVIGNVHEELWDEDKLIEAVRHGDLETVQWLRENDCSSVDFEDYFRK